MSEREPDARWNGLPVYRCRICKRYERVNHLADVLEHERAAHGIPLRQSQVLGPDGEPVLLEEE